MLNTFQPIRFRSGAGFFALSLLLCLFLTAGPHAMALPQFRDTAKAVYSFKPGGVIDTAGCLLCHSKPTGGQQLNPYGASIKTALDAQHLQAPTPEVLHSLDAKDADGDGASNADEFKADTLPGDVASHPAGAGPKAQTSESTTVDPGLPGAVSPFDIKAAILAKHAQHPVLVHFPIALFVISLFFDLLGLWRKKPLFHTAAYYNLAVAAISSVVTVITGLIAWQWLFKGEALSTDQNLQLHLIFGIVSCVLISALWFLRFQQQKLPDPPPPGISYLILAFIAFVIVALTGHLGGFVSGVPM